MENKIKWKKNQLDRKFPSLKILLGFVLLVALKIIFLQNFNLFTICCVGILACFKGAF